MRKFVICLISLMLSFGFFVTDASAKRFGGGRSFGSHYSHQSSHKSHQSNKSSHQKQNNKKNFMGGILGGLLIGGLISSLFMGHGFATGMMTWLMLGAFVLFLVTMFRKKMMPQWQANHSQFAQGRVFESNPSSHSFTNQNNWQFRDSSSCFDEDQFLRQAKVIFNRLQAANDQRNLRDIQTFTTPQVFAEIKMQHDEQLEANNITEVNALHAKLLDISFDDSRYIASVHFTGFIKENNEPELVLNEIWTLSQEKEASDWIVAGVKQSD